MQMNRRALVASMLAGTALASCASIGSMGVNLVDAIKRLLGISAKNGLAKLASQGGFLNNAASKIGLGDVLGGSNGSAAMLVLSQLGVLGGIEAKVNQAAESAVGKIAPWVADSISGLSIADANAIINGPGDAATNLLKTAISSRLQSELGGAVGGALQALNVLGPLAGMAGINIGGLNLGNLTQGVTGKASNAIFNAIASEERAIRANPSATGDPLIIAAFGRG
jgi:Protein of unknown function (DUF4197)